jgi:hypothetical protein
MQPEWRRSGVLHWLPTFSQRVEQQERHHAEARYAERVAEALVSDEIHPIAMRPARNDPASSSETD